MKLQRLLCLTRKAVDEYRMIDDGDRIAVGISGGKDSLTLLTALRGLQRFYPKHFDIVGVTCDLGFEGMDFSPVRQMCDDMGVEYHIVKTGIAGVVFDSRKESNPCSLCAKMRKGALNEAVKALGCNKVAYAHSMDDMVESMMLSMIYEARFYTFSPVTYLDRADLTVIRPLMFVPEEDIIGFVNKQGYTIVKNRCPADGYTRRQYVKELLCEINHNAPGVKERLFHAVLEGNIKGWPERHEDPLKGKRGAAKKFQNP